MLLVALLELDFNEGEILMKRKILALIVILVGVAVVSTGCFFSTGTTEKETRATDYAYLDLEIQGEGYVRNLKEGENRFEKDASVDLKARADEGWEFKRWEGAADKYKADTSVLMNRDRKVKVIFEKKDAPVTDVSFTYERIARREYKFTATKPSNGKYWEWKFPDLNYWRGKVDSNTIEHKFSSSGNKRVILEIYDEDENKIGRYEKTIDVH